MGSYGIVRGTASSKDPSVALKVEIKLERVPDFLVHNGAWGTVSTFVRVILVREEPKEILTLITKRQDNNVPNVVAFSYYDECDFCVDPNFLQCLCRTDQKQVDCKEKDVPFKATSSRKICITRQRLSAYMHRGLPCSNTFGNWPSDTPSVRLLRYERHLGNKSGYLYKISTCKT